MRREAQHKADVNTFWILGMDRCGGSSYTSGGARTRTRTAVTKNSPASQRIVPNTRPRCNPALGLPVWRDYILYTWRG